jgi:hypothetical protein
VISGPLTPLANDTSDVPAVFEIRLLHDLPTFQKVGLAKDAKGENEIGLRSC